MLSHVKVKNNYFMGVLKTISLGGHFHWWVFRHAPSFGLGGVFGMWVVVRSWGKQQRVLRHCGGCFEDVEKRGIGKNGA
jgi:hypothetical protein